MGRLDSPLRDRVIFIEGAPRSGTTWLLHLLATHPQIAGVNAEAHLFDSGLDRLFDNFDGRERHRGGLRGFVERDELVELARALCDGVLMAMRAHVSAGGDEPEFVVEKTPAGRVDGLDLARKAECFPDGWYVHIVRDRDAVIRSLMKAPFMSDRSYDACAEVRDRAVEHIREHFGGLERYRELDYAQLRADPVGETRELFRWLGVRADDEVAATVRALSRERFSGLGALAAPARAGRREALRAAPGAAVARARGVAARLRRPEPEPDPLSGLAFTFVGALRQRDTATLVALTHRSLELTLRQPEGDTLVEGDAAREELCRLAETLFRRRWVNEWWASSGGGPAEWWTAVRGRPFWSVFGSTLNGDGERADLAFGLTLEDDLVRQLLIVSAGPLTGRPVAQPSRS